MDAHRPLLDALESVRLKMTRQTMRFLGDAEAVGPVGPRGGVGKPGGPGAPLRGPPWPPPAEGEAREARPCPTAATTWSTAWRRRRAWARAARVGPGRRARRPRGDGRGEDASCCIRVRSPSVSILLQRGDQPLQVTRLRPCAKMVIRLKGHAGLAPTAQSGESPSSSSSKASSQVVEESVMESKPQSPPVTAPAGEQEPSRQRAGGALAPHASNESLNSFVRRRAAVILHQVARSIAWFEAKDERREDEDGGAQAEAAAGRQRLLRQISRVAAYTAASRHLRHAAQLHIVSGVASRRCRRGRVRYSKLECPPRPEQDSAPTLPHRLLRSPPSAPTVAAVNINDLPKALLLNIFSRLDQRALSLHVAPVCRAWHRLARSRQFWRELTFDGAFRQHSAQSLVNVLRVSPGLWTLELIACRDVDVVLAEVHLTCRKLRTLVVDSCSVSPQLQRQSRASPRHKTPLESVLEQCACLQYLIVAFTPCIGSGGFFSLLGRRCWSLQCFLVSADDADVHDFCEALSGAAGCVSEELLGPRSGSWSRTVSPPACPAATASDNCQAAHPPRVTSGLRRRVTAVRTRNHLLRVLALRPDAELRLLQWRMADDHATLDYFGVEARLSFQ